MRTNLFSKTILLALTGGLLTITLLAFLVLQAVPMFGYAQQAPVLQVACVPSNNQVAAGEAVSFNAQVLSSTQGTVSYAWEGENIQTVNAPQVAISYTTPGIKTAKATVTVGNLTEEATCSVEVVGTASPTGNLRVTCAPSREEVGRDQPVVWRARVTGASGNITYRWSGVNITSKNEPAISTSYGSIGTKRTTVTVTSGGVTTDATCSVNVVGTPTNQTQTGGQQNQGGNFADILKNLLGGQQGGSGNPLGGGQGGNPLGGNQPGGNRPPAGGSQGVNQPGGTFQPNNPSSDSTATRLSEPQTNTSRGSQLKTEDCRPTSESTQSTPTAEYAVPVDTVSINEYIWKFVLKEAGDPMGSNGPEDAKAACEADELSRALAESAGNWLMKSFGGNPAFIEDWVALFADLETIHFEAFIENYKKNKQQAGGAAGGGQKDVVLSNLEARQNTPPLYASQIPQSKSQKYWENYASGLEVRGNNIFRFLSANEEVEAQQAGAIETEKLAQTINRGISDQVDPQTGEILVPGSVAGDIAITRILNPETRLAGGADEVGETLEKLKEHLQSPSADWLRQQGGGGGGLDSIT